MTTPLSYRYHPQSAPAQQHAVYQHQQPQPTASTSTASAYAYAQQQQRQFQPQSGSNYPKYSLTHSPNDPVPPNPAQLRRPSPLADRPHSIDELARIAAQDTYDRFGEIKQDLRYAEVYMAEGKIDLDAKDLEWAFVHYARAATLVLQRIPTNVHYNDMKQVHHDRLKENGNVCLEEMSKIKPTLVDRYEAYLARHPSPAPIDMQRVRSAMAVRDNEGLARRAQYNKLKKAATKEAARRQEEEQERLAEENEERRLAALRKAREEEEERKEKEVTAAKSVEEKMKRARAERERVAAQTAYDNAPRMSGHEYYDVAPRATYEDARRRVSDGSRRNQGEETDRGELERRKREMEEEGRRREAEIARRKSEEAQRFEAAQREQAQRIEAAQREQVQREQRQRQEREQREQMQRQEQAREHAEREAASRRKMEELEFRRQRDEARRAEFDDSRRREQPQPPSLQVNVQYSDSLRLPDPPPPPPPRPAESPSSASSSGSSKTVRQDGLPVLPLESPTRAESGVYHPQPQLASSKPDRAIGRTNSFNSPITTTSPPPKEGVALSNWMTHHQRAQGYTPSLQSMFCSVSSTPVIVPPTSGLLFSPNHPEGPSVFNLPTSPDRPPAHMRHMWQMAGYQVPEEPAPKISGIKPRPEKGDLRILKPEQVREREETVWRPGVELKIVKVPHDVLPRFLDVAAVNTARNKETCGLLMGRMIPAAGGKAGSEYKVVTLLIPKQRSTSDTCTMEEEELVSDFADKRKMMTLGWIHTHPTQSCFMSSLDLHTHAGFQSMLPEFFAIVCAPRQVPNCGIFRLTDPPGLKTILKCEDKASFHPHPEVPIYTDADKGHVVWDDSPLEIVDLR